MALRQFFSKSTVPSQKQINELIDHAGEGNAKAVEDFLKRFGDKYVDAQYEGVGITALGSALWKEQPTIAEILLKHGANVNRANGDGYTLLMSAARDNKAEMAALLLKNGANSAAADKHGRTALSIARRHHFKEVIQLLDPTFDPSKAPGPGEVDNFVAAARDGKLAEVDAYIAKYGPSYVDAKTAQANTAMIAATLEGRFDVMDRLVANGANVNADYLGFGMPLLQMTVEFKRTDAMRHLIDLGATVDENTRDAARRHRLTNDLEEAVERAAYRARRAADTSLPPPEPTEREILAMKSDARAGDLNKVQKHIAEFGLAHIGEHLADSAVWGGQATLAKELWDMGVKPDTGLLNAALSGGKKDVAAEMLARGVQMDDKSLIAAISGNSPETYELVMDRIDVNKGLNGMPPLFIAALIGKKDYVTDLLARGADATMKSPGGETPRELADFRGFREIADILAQAEGHLPPTSPAQTAPRPK